MQYKPHNVHLKTKKKNEYLAQTNTAIYIYILTIIILIIFIISLLFSKETHGHPRLSKEIL